METQTIQEPFTQGTDAPKLNVLGTDVQLLVTGDQSAGAVDIWFNRFQSGQGIPPHIHEHEDESIYVVEGQLTVETPDGDQKVDAGNFIFLPRNRPHGLFNKAKEDLLVLIVASPSGMKDLLNNLAQLTPNDPPERVIELSARQGITFLPPKDPQ